MGSCATAHVFQISLRLLLVIKQSNTRTRGVQALNTYAKNMKMSATIATGQASLAVKGATGQVKNSLARGMDNLQTNLNGSSPALAPAGGTGIVCHIMRWIREGFNKMLAR